MIKKKIAFIGALPLLYNGFEIQIFYIKQNANNRMITCYKQHDPQWKYTILYFVSKKKQWKSIFLIYHCITEFGTQVLIGALVLCVFLSWFVPNERPKEECMQQNIVSDGAYHIDC